MPADDFHFVSLQAFPQILLLPWNGCISHYPGKMRQIHSDYAMWPTIINLHSNQLFSKQCGLVIGLFSIHQQMFSVHDVWYLTLQHRLFLNTTTFVHTEFGSYFTRFAFIQTCRGQYGKELLITKSLHDCPIQREIWLVWVACYVNSIRTYKENP